jgi:DNA-binding transcriptional LysR family regulator
MLQPQSFGANRAIDRSNADGRITTGMKERRLDIHSLVCLEALVSARSVTRAAEQIGMSQPGMSNALARLRKALRDPLLVNTAQGMVPTPRAIELARSVRYGLQFFDAVLADHGPFDPAAATGSATIATTDYAGVRLIPRLMHRLNAEAPGISVKLRLPDPLHIKQWLEEGECDLAVGHFPRLAPSLRTSILLEEPIVCIARRDHPLIERHLTRQIFTQAGHVVFTSPFAGISTLEATVEEALLRDGIKRRIDVSVASLLLSAPIVAETDLIATMGRGLAEYHSASLGISIFPFPFEVAKLGMGLVWHDRTHESGLHRWIRRTFRDISRSETQRNSSATIPDEIVSRSTSEMLT